LDKDKEREATMRILRARRLWAGAAVLSAIPLATMAFAGAAPAVSFGRATVVCTHLRGNALTARLKGCTAAPTGGTGTITFNGTSGGDVSWANGTRTRYTSSYTSLSEGCPEPYIASKIVGSVTSSTNGSIPVGAQVKMTICSDFDGLLMSEKGTLIKF
jgi:hypothetical protein